MALANFLTRIDPALANSFTPAQLQAMELHFGMRYKTRHIIDWRRRVRLPFMAFYFVILVGPERPE